MLPMPKASDEVPALAHRRAIRCLALATALPIEPSAAELLIILTGAESQGLASGRYALPAKLLWLAPSR